jgi:hypothetical protein
MTASKPTLGLLAAAAGFVWLFWDVGRDLIRDWTNDGNYSAASGSC